MPTAIKVLPDNLVNKIAAGEVVERPASVVKELIENAVDAGATDIVVDIEQAGKRLIRVTDNGSGMGRDDARLAFERHATSKISSEADLDAIRTMGFRGEALSSIAAVSRVRMLTTARGAATGTLVEIEGGRITTVADAAASPGTSLEVNHLFSNTPARLKFLKSPATEFSHIASAVSHQAMAHPDIRFKLTHNKKAVLELPASADRAERAFQIHGREIAGHLTGFSGSRDPVRVSGLIAQPAYTRADRTYQDFYVNGRFVRNASLTHALYEACRDMLMRDRHPVAFIFLDLDPAFVDVNVHPAKAEVRFRNQSQIHDLVRDVIREALRGQGQPLPAATGVTETSAPEEYAGRVREAIADFGSRIADFETMQAHKKSIPGTQTSSLNLQSAIRIPRSEFFSPLAQVHDSFIIAQSPEGMALIDQHAAHERVLFEKLQDQHAAGAVPSQNLLLPVQTELGPADREVFAEHLPDLRSLGFVVEDFGGGTFVIKAVPALLAGGDYQKLLHDILDEIKVHGSSRQMDKLRDGLLSVMACHPAIKVHRKLDMREMEVLIRDLFSCRMPHTCPHGRPTVVRFSMDEIRKMFKRS